jgi:sugar phosphate isomerase/epimerase
MMRNMKISIDCASFDFQSAAELAARCDFDTIELPAQRNPSVASACNALFTAPTKILEILSDTNTDISAINIGSDHEELPARIALAAELTCSHVRMKTDWLFAKSESALPAIIDRLLSHADTAATNSITILLENQPTRDSALRLWHLLDRLNHPSIGCCWNTFTAAQAGDAPAVAVPMLNTRIRYVHLQDAKANSPCELGQGDLPLRNTLNRLRGIGCDGYLLIGSGGFPIPDPTSIEQSLTAARTVLQQWQALPTPKPS